MLLHEPIEHGASAGHDRERWNQGCAAFTSSCVSVNWRNRTIRPFATLYTCANTAVIERFVVAWVPA